MFNGIEFWGIWRKEQEFAASILGSRNKPLFGMEGSMIHYDIYHVLPQLIELWGLSLRDLELLTVGMVNDIFAEQQNDDCKYATLATQEDMDRF